MPVGDLLLELNNRAHLLSRRISRPTLSSKRTVALSTSARAVAASASAPAKPPGPRAGHQEAGDRALPGSGMGMIVGLQLGEAGHSATGELGNLSVNANRRLGPFRNRAFDASDFALRSLAFARAPV